jgi:hypothetical protein
VERVRAHEQLEDRARLLIGEQRRLDPVGHHLGLVDRPPQQVELATVDRHRRGATRCVLLGRRRVVVLTAPWRLARARTGRRAREGLRDRLT